MTFFTLKPKVRMHGKQLKKWYRRVYLAVGGRQFLPTCWVMHPVVKVPADKLSAVMDTLHKDTIF